MATTALIRIIDAARTHCPSVLEGTMRRELYDTVKEFFDESNSWLFELVVQIQSGSNDYILNPCQNAIVTRLMYLGRPRTSPPLPPVYLPTDPCQFLQSWSINNSQEVYDTMYNIPQDAVLLDAGIKCPIMRIRWNPESNDLWIATLAMNVTDPTDSEGLPQAPNWIINKYYKYIADGLISRLMLQPGKPYSSQQGASFHGRRFLQGVGLARTEARHRYTFSSQRWVFPQGWTQRRPYIR
jgi:hypothetical protein